MGRPRGGLTTKIHTVVDASDLPLRFALSPGQAHGDILAGPLLDNQPPADDGFMLANKTYDAEWISYTVAPTLQLPSNPCLGRRSLSTYTRCAAAA